MPDEKEIIKNGSGSEEIVTMSRDIARLEKEQKELSVAADKEEKPEAKQDVVITKEKEALKEEGKPPDIAKQKKEPEKPLTKIFTVSLAANPEKGGTLSGQGKYKEGEDALVIASPSKGFSFLEWTENDKTVSREREYSFKVTDNQRLVAVFEKSLRPSAVEEPPKIEKKPPVEEPPKIEKKPPVEEPRFLEKPVKEGLKEKPKEEDGEKIEEKTKTAEETEKTKEEEIQKEISKIEAKIAEILKEEGDLKNQREVLTRKKGDFDASLGDIIKKEKEIEERKEEIEEKEATVKDPRKEKDVKKERWEWEEQRRNIEKERWEQSEKIRRVEKQTDVLDNKIKELAGQEQSFLQQKESLLHELKKAKLLKEKSNIEKALEEISEPAAMMEKEKGAVLQKKKSVEEEVRTAREKEEALRKEKAGIEEKESQTGDLDKKKEIEKARWDVEDRIKREEKNRWEKEEALGKLRQEIKDIEKKYSDIAKKKDSLERNLEEITSSLSGKKAEEQEPRKISGEDYRKVQEYIYRNSREAEEDLKRVKEDPEFFDYILRMAKK